MRGDLDVQTANKVLEATVGSGQLSAPMQQGRTDITMGWAMTHHLRMNGPVNGIGQTGVTLLARSLAPLNEASRLLRHRGISTFVFVWPGVITA